MRNTSIFSFIGGLLSFAAIVIISGLLERRGIGEGSYFLTDYLMAAYSLKTAIILFGLSFAAGLTLQLKALPFALGAVLLPAVFAGVEIALEPTSHNLLPIEAILYWTPIFVLALIGASLGGRLAFLFIARSVEASSFTDRG